MYISRVQVSEGFLDGLDISFSPGLNVVIGARGTGKTSVIELIRYCLDVPGHTQESSKRSREHALSILGPGEVTITISDGDDDFIVRRAAGEAAQRIPVMQLPIVFSQTEIETVGLQSSGRLRLIDGFAMNLRELSDREEGVVSSIHSATVQVDALQRELDDLASQLADLPRVEAELAKLAPTELELEKLSAESAKKTGALGQLSQKLSSASVASERASRSLDDVMQWRHRVQSVVDASPSLLELDNYPALRQKVSGVVSQLSIALREIIELESAVASVKQVSEADRSSLEREARTLRVEVETLQAGSGAIISSGMKLRERRAQLLALKDLHRGKLHAFDRLLQRRSDALDALDEIRDQRYAERKEVAQYLSTRLGPRIKVSVLKAARTDAYAAALIEALRGSGIRYNDLAASIAETVSPRELISMAESDDVAQFSDMVSVNIDRSSRVLATLRQSGLSNLATVLVDDEVSLELLDGAVYKGIADLSTGQRCTTILPIVLQHSHRLVIVDQPEDHIDNAFIADTLVRAIVGRPSESQLIVSTHNANIPVLGNARSITQLNSDGRRGFVEESGELSSHPIVEAISSVMEGGRDAFAGRAEFYDETPADDS